MATLNQIEYMKYTKLTGGSQVARIWRVDIRRREEALNELILIRKKYSAFCIYRIVGAASQVLPSPRSHSRCERSLLRARRLSNVRST